jgi:hypothetical protein
MRSDTLKINGNDEISKLGSSESFNNSIYLKNCHDLDIDIESIYGDLYIDNCSNLTFSKLVTINEALYANKSDNLFFPKLWNLGKGIQGIDVTKKTFPALGYRNNVAEIDGEYDPADVKRRNDMAQMKTHNFKEKKYKFYESKISKLHNSIEVMRILAEDKKELKGIGKISDKIKSLFVDSDKVFTANVPNMIERIAETYLELLGIHRGLQNEEKAYNLSFLDESEKTIKELESVIKKYKVEDSSELNADSKNLTRNLLNKQLKSFMYLANSFHTWGDGEFTNYLADRVKKAKDEEDRLDDSLEKNQITKGQHTRMVQNLRKSVKSAEKSLQNIARLPGGKKLKSGIVNQVIRSFRNDTSRYSKLFNVEENPWDVDWYEAIHDGYDYLEKTLVNVKENLEKAINKYQEKKNKERPMDVSLNSEEHKKYLKNKADQEKKNKEKEDFDKENQRQIRQNELNKRQTQSDYDDEIMRGVR